MKSENTDKKEKRAYSSIDGAPDDESFEKGTEKSAKSESLGYTKVKDGERSGHDAFNKLSDDICVTTHLMESTSDPHMQDTLIMKDSTEEETSSDKVTPDIPERIGSKMGNGKGEMDPDILNGIDIANDVNEDKDYIKDTTKVERSESDVGPETKGDAVAIVTQPAKVKICNIPDMKSGS